MSKMNLPPTPITLLFSWLLLYQFQTQLFLLSFPILKPNHTDKTTLLAFKSQITNDPFQVLTSWNDSSNFCKWSGITCGHRHQRVTIIDLHSLNLEGRLTPFIGNLTFLRILDLHNNNLSHSIPPELGRLFRLEVFNLQNNKFFGEFPANISYCSNLQFLHIGENRQLTGQIPAELGFLTGLKQINFERNHMVGRIPESFGNLSSLETFYVPDNNLQGPIPTGFGQLKRLQEFSVGVNNLSGIIPPSMYNLSFISIFSLPANQFYGSLPSNLFQTLPLMETFEVSDNNFSGLVPKTLSNASNLIYFGIGGNNFIGKMPSLASSQNLRELDMVSNRIGFGVDQNSNGLEFLYPLANNTSLERMDLYDNFLGGTIPETICNFSRKLWLLGLGKNQLRGNLPKEIGNLVSLQALGFEQNKLTGNIPSSIGRLANLIDLFFDGNQLSGSIPLELGNITLLEQFDVGFNNLQGGIPSNLGNWKSLMYLGLASNNFNGSIPKEIMEITSLVILFLEENHLVGSIPSEVGNLVNIEEFFVFENKLSGEIPGNIGSCVALELLLLQENHFNGTIPVSFDSLRGLQYLNLSHNKLSGGIPSFLEDFKLLYLDLSFNDFDGEVPTRGVFENESAISVEGNKNLCGGAANLHLPKCTSNKSKEGNSADKFKFRVLVSCGVVGILLVVASIAIIYCALQRKIPKSASLSSAGKSFPQVSYQDLVKATDGFSSVNLIGFGSFGSVYKGVLRVDEYERFVAVKVLNLLQRGAVKSFTTECEALVNTRHRNLVKVLTACSSIDSQGNDFKALVYEYMADGSLEKWLHPPCTPEEAGQTRHLNLIQRLEIAIDVACAIDYLHNHCQAPLVHCDLKPSNVLLDNNMTAHIGDFGLARFLIDDNCEPTSSIATSSTNVKGTIGYAAPEYGIGSEISTYGDIYSYGILLLEIFTRKGPTDGMFVEGLSLHKYVKMALLDQVAEVLDPLLLRQIDQETNGDPSHRLNQAKKIHKMESLASILSIGVACSSEFPRDRMDISDVVAKLCRIRDVLMKT